MHAAGGRGALPVGLSAPDHPSAPRPFHSIPLTSLCPTPHLSPSPKRRRRLARRTASPLAMPRRGRMERRALRQRRRSRRASERPAAAAPRVAQSPEAPCKTTQRLQGQQGQQGDPRSSQQVTPGPCRWHPVQRVDTCIHTHDTMLRQCGFIAGSAHVPSVHSRDFSSCVPVPVEPAGSQALTKPFPGGWGFGLAATDDGTLYAWGVNAATLLGKQGDLRA